MGLGHKFLRHVARNRVLLHLVEVTPDIDELKKNIEVIRNELKAYDETLVSREQILVFTKIDLLPADELEAKKKKIADAGIEGLFISSHTGAGIEPLLDRLAVNAAEWRAANIVQVQEADAAAKAEAEAEANRDIA